MLEGGANGEEGGQSSADGMNVEQGKERWRRQTMAPPFVAAVDVHGSKPPRMAKPKLN